MQNRQNVLLLSVRSRQQRLLCQCYVGDVRPLFLTGVLLCCCALILSEYVMYQVSGTVFKSLSVTAYLHTEMSTTYILAGTRLNLLVCTACQRKVAYIQYRLAGIMSVSL